MQYGGSVGPIAGSRQQAGASSGNLPAEGQAGRTHGVVR